MDLIKNVLALFKKSAISQKDVIFNEIENSESTKEIDIINYQFNTIDVASNYSHMSLMNNDEIHSFNSNEDGLEQNLEIDEIFNEPQDITNINSENTEILDLDDNTVKCIKEFDSILASVKNRQEMIVSDDLEKLEPNYNDKDSFNIDSEASIPVHVISKNDYIKNDAAQQLDNKTTVHSDTRTTTVEFSHDLMVEKNLVLNSTEIDVKTDVISIEIDKSKTKAESHSKIGSADFENNSKIDRCNCLETVSIAVNDDKKVNSHHETSSIELNTVKIEKKSKDATVIECEKTRQIHNDIKDERRMISVAEKDDNDKTTSLLDFDNNYNMKMNVIDTNNTKMNVSNTMVTEINLDSDVKIEIRRNDREIDNRNIGPIPLEVDNKIYLFNNKETTLIRIDSNTKMDGNIKTNDNIPKIFDNKEITLTRIDNNTKFNYNTVTNTGQNNNDLIHGKNIDNNTRIFDDKEITVTRIGNNTKLNNNTVTTTRQNNNDLIHGKNVDIDFCNARIFDNKEITVTRVDNNTILKNKTVTTIWQNNNDLTHGQKIDNSTSIFDNKEIIVTRDDKKTELDYNTVTVTRQDNNIMHRINIDKDTKIFNNEITVTTFDNTTKLNNSTVANQTAIDNIQESLEIISISSDEIINLDDISFNSEESIESDCGYHSSDFEFITETEAKLDGFIINYKPNNYTRKALNNDNQNQFSLNNLDKSPKNTDNDLEKTPKVDKENQPGPSGLNNYESYRNKYARPVLIDRRYRERHVVPEGEEYLNLFRGMYDPVVSSMFMENKSVRTSKSMLVEFEGIGFERQLVARRRHSSEDEYEDEANVTAKKIRKMYPEDNRHRRRNTRNGPHLL